MSEKKIQIVMPSTLHKALSSVLTDFDGTAVVQQDSGSLKAGKILGCVLAWFCAQDKASRFEIATEGRSLVERRYGGFAQRKKAAPKGAVQVRGLYAPPTIDEASERKGGPPKGKGGPKGRGKGSGRPKTE